MTKFTKELNSIISGHSYNEAVINQAINIADTLEVSICLKALKGGLSSHSSWMVLQDFICRLDS